MSAGDWAIALGTAATIVPVLETVKWIVRRRLVEPTPSSATR
jgi:hypothetical protein